MHSRWFAGGQIAKMPGGAEYSSSKRQRMGLSQQSVVAATKDQGSCDLGAEAAIRRDEAAGVLWQVCRGHPRLLWIGLRGLLARSPDCLKAEDGLLECPSGAVPSSKGERT